MTIKVKTHVLCHRLGTELSEPSVFPAFELAYKEMETCYNSALKEYNEGSCYKDESRICDDNAVIVTNGGWEEWTITECELEIGDLQSFASVFEQYLNENYIKYKQFAAEVPQLMATARELQANITSSMIDLRTLLTDAVSEAVAIKDGGSIV